eukprot:CAMPEP_0204269086 /NCGR_PEP_ID=MMETSP0468-20130131/15575_1 /ASSEMBLY_ACC=CAM_ASM_000383 /TAXON_ID=2969 /ORGANISM="Oxyrrhis marina" /LENGTH=222 /DNA_ID=CAMNT_0051244429 /DNA_START=54 /DNA_END=722 /DNA_ORIENTATION=-
MAAASVLAVRTPEESAPSQPRIFSQSETILIFDWDDTILPSSWLAKQGLGLDEESVVSEAQREELKALEVEAAGTIEEAVRCGEVVLVTNAQAGWIEMSCAKFFPGLKPVVDKLRVASARTMYESASLQSPFEWKFHAFSQEIASSVARGCLNVISVGDSQHEREAIIRATQGIDEIRTKSLKFVERPEIDQLRRELGLIRGCLGQVVQHDGNLDLCIRVAV